MSAPPAGRWIARHADLVFKLVVAALLTLWIALPVAAPRGADGAALTQEAAR